MIAALKTLPRSVAIWAMVLALSLCAKAQNASAALNEPRPVVAYVDLTGKLPNLEQIPWDVITHINVSFAGIDARGNCAWMATSGKDVPDTSGALPQAVGKLVQARNAHNPKVKLILSVGGWTMSYRFSYATQTDEGTARLANSCVAMVQDLGLDGLDYDWEYPTKLGKANCPQGLKCATANDPTQLTQLLGASRAALDKVNTSMPLTVAVYMVPGSRGIPYDVAGMDPYLDFWNIMSYDNAAPNWSSGTGFHAAILDAQNSLNLYVAQGATPSKLNQGLPYYGYVWHNANNANIGSKAMGNSKNSAQIDTHVLLATYANDPGCTKYSDRNGDYYFCDSGEHQGDWTAVDTERVLIEKTAYVRNNNFGGMMMWSVNMDDKNASLTRAVAKALNGPKATTAMSDAFQEILSVISPKK